MTRTTDTHEAPDLDAFIAKVAEEGASLYRDFPWRHTRDPYAVLVSEVMLQQTQVQRVVGYYEQWLADFPTLEALAAAPVEAVLRAWQGLGYNRRAMALKRLAEHIIAVHVDSGAVGPAQLPRTEAGLRALPGVGPATAAGVLAFAFDEPSAYLETNVRTVFLHELFADRDGVKDSEIAPLVALASERAHAAGLDPRAWNYALLDYGAHLKRLVPNPSRRSAHHTRQSTFEGSRRQKRAWLLRVVLDDPGHTAHHYARDLATAETRAGREAPSVAETAALLQDLVADGMLATSDGRFRTA